MAEERGVYRKRKLPSMSELLSKGKGLLGLSKNKERKARQYEYGSDPVSGLRNNKGTYSGQSKRRRKDTNSILETSAHHERDDLSENASASYGHENADQTTCASGTVGGEMKEFLLETQELLQRLQESNPPKRQNWAERQTLLTESWEEQRSTIFEELLEATYAVPENIMCSRCLDKAAVVRCDMCSTIRHLCPECDQQVHESWPFHDRDAIVNGHYFPIPATTTWNSNGQWEIVARSLPLRDLCCTTCGGNCEPDCILPNTHCIVVSLRGRFDVNHRRYKCLQCGKMLCTSEPVVIIQSGFWPGSIKDMTYVFDKELFLFWDILQKQLPGVSEGAFLKSLELFSKRKGRVSIFITGQPFNI